MRTYSEIVYLVGNKVDLEKEREVKYEKAKKVCF
jgi:hypothetical protein